MANEKVYTKDIQRKSDSRTKNRRSQKKKKKKSRRICLALICVLVVVIILGVCLAVAIVLFNNNQNSQAIKTSQKTTPINLISNRTVSVTTSTVTTATQTTTTISTTIAASTTAATHTTTTSDTTTTGTTITPGQTTTITDTTTTTTTPVTCVSMQWNATGETIAGTGFAGSASDELDEPWNLFVDSNYNLYIADSANHRIQYWPAGASNGTTIAGVNATPGASATELNTPSDVFVDTNGNFYVADRNNSRIQYFPNGSTIGITVSSGWGGTGAFRGVQVTSTGIIYGSDTSNHALWRNNTVPLGYLGGGGASNQLNGNQGIALDTTVNVGYVYIANTNQHTIVQWIPGSSTGTVVAGSNGVSGSTSTTMASPVAVRIDPNGNLFVVDNNNHRIQVYCRYPTISSTARTVVGITGTAGSSSTNLHYPAGLALDKDLNIYVADTSNHRIQKFVRTV